MNINVHELKSTMFYVDSYNSRHIVSKNITWDLTVRAFNVKIGPIHATEKYIRSFQVYVYNRRLLDLMRHQIGLEINYTLFVDKIYDRGINAAVTTTLRTLHNLN